MANLVKIQPLSLSKIHKKLKKAGIEIQIGEAYNFYDCGCIINNKNDENRLKHNFDTHQRVRACPYCDEEGVGFLVTKYKKCQCGMEFNSKGVHASFFCNKCPNSLRTKGIIKVKIEIEYGIKLDFQKRFNGDFQDSERWNCLFRDNCAWYYREHDAVPCLNCELYIKQDLDITKIEPRETIDNTIYN